MQNYHFANTRSTNRWSTVPHRRTWSFWSDLLTSGHSAVTRVSSMSTVTVYKHVFWRMYVTWQWPAICLRSITLLTSCYIDYRSAPFSTRKCRYSEIINSFNLTPLHVIYTKTLFNAKHVGYGFRIMLFDDDGWRVEHRTSLCGKRLSSLHGVSSV